MKKFLDYARWDLTIRRSTYTRFMGMMALAASIPTIIYMIDLVYRVFKGGYDVLADVLSMSNIDATSITFFIVGTIQMLCIALMFTTLKDRPNRLAEFMLPAPNWMKFLWRALLVTVGVFVLGQVLVIVLGLVRYLFTALFVGFGAADLMIWPESIKNISLIFQDAERANQGIAQETGGLIPSVYVLFVMMAICAFAYRAVFVLTSAFKYRRGILYGFLVHGIVFLMLVFVASNNTDVNPDFTPRELAWTFYGITFVHLVILVGCWWGAWRLYRSAQLTCRRNP